MNIQVLVIVEALAFIGKKFYLFKITQYPNPEK